HALHDALPICCPVPLALLRVSRGRNHGPGVACASRSSISLSLSITAPPSTRRGTAAARRARPQPAPRPRCRGSPSCRGRLPRWPTRPGRGWSSLLSVLLALLPVPRRTPGDPVVLHAGLAERVGVGGVVGGVGGLVVGGVVVGRGEVGGGDGHAPTPRSSPSCNGLASRAMISGR